MSNREAPHSAWPPLPWNEWQETAETLHMWTQIVGKTVLELTPTVNHWWNVALHVTARGLATPLVPCGRGAFDAEFDLIGHQLHLCTSWGQRREIILASRPVAEFYREYNQVLRDLGIKVTLYDLPVEVSHPVAFGEDRVHHTYAAEYAQRFWRILVQTQAVFERFRARFVGKCSPVHFFWGSFDLAVSRFSGRRAPERPDADVITGEAYSHEVISAGFWPGNGGFGQAAFYSYTAPQPAGLPEQRVQPDAALYSQDLKEFLLLYDDARATADPANTILAFLESTYEAGSRLAGWDRSELERSPSAGWFRAA